MAIFRVQKRTQYVQIPNSTLREAALSFAARGLLAAMLTHSDEWEFNMKHLQSLSPDSEYRIREAMRELIAAGYVVRRRVQRDWHYDVYEKAQPVTADQDAAQLDSSSANIASEDSSSTNVTSVNLTSVNIADPKKEQSLKKEQERKKGAAPATGSPEPEPRSSPSLGSQVDAALADSESPEARAFLEANGISTDQRPLWNLKKFLRQTLGDQADHPQVVGNLTAWAAAGHTLQEIRAAWLQAVARWKREPKGGKLRPVHFFVDLLNGSYKPDSHDLREQAEAAAAVQEQAQLSAPQPGDRVRLPDGTTDTVHDFDAWSNLVELVNTTSAFRPEDLQVIS